MGCACQGYKPFLPVVWALREVELALGDGTDARTAQALQAFQHEAFKFRGHCGAITNWLKQPVPFCYFHILTVLQILNLTWISYGLATMDIHWILAVILFPLVCVAFLGLKEVGVAMSDPFGDDDTDFDTEALLNAAYQNAIACLKDTRETLGGEASDLGNPLTGTMPTTPSARQPPMAVPSATMSKQEESSPKVTTKSKDEARKPLIQEAAAPGYGSGGPSGG